MTNKFHTIIKTTFPDKDSAKSAARLLVERRLAACVAARKRDAAISD